MELNKNQIKRNKKIIYVCSTLAELYLYIELIELRFKLVERKSLRNPNSCIYVIINILYVCISREPIKKKKKDYFSPFKFVVCVRVFFL